MGTSIYGVKFSWTSLYDWELGIQVCLSIMIQKRCILWSNPVGPSGNEAKFKMTSLSHPEATPSTPSRWRG